MTAQEQLPDPAAEVHHEVQSRLAEITADTEARLGIVPTELVELPLRGPHRLLVIDETAQRGANFKYNGAAVAIDRLVAEHPEVETLVTGTAGNFGAALAAAAQTAGRRAVLLTPCDLPSPKRNNMERAGGIVQAGSSNVMEAIEQAEAMAAADPTTAFVHPFNNLDAISGQALVGRRIAEGLRAHAVTGPVDVLVQRGGGSLIAGISSVLADAYMPDTDVRVREVRPERVDGQLDRRYDGLAVDTPGGYAAALLGDKRYVHDTVSVSELDTGRAAHRMATAFHRRFEPSGLAGAAAFEQLMRENDVPTTYVVVLSGANVAPEVYADFADAPRRDQRRILGELAALQQPPTYTSRALGRSSLVASSPTATLRQHCSA